MVATATFSSRGSSGLGGARWLSSSSSSCACRVDAPATARAVVGSDRVVAATVLVPRTGGAAVATAAAAVGDRVLCVYQCVNHPVRFLSQPEPHKRHSTYPSGRKQGVAAGGGAARARAALPRRAGRAWARCTLASGPPVWRLDCCWAVGGLIQICRWTIYTVECDRMG